MTALDKDRTRSMLAEHKRKRVHIPLPKPGIALAYLTCILVWGTTWFAVRMCVLPGGFKPFTALGLRFLLAGIVLGLIWATLKIYPRDYKQFFWTLFAAIGGTISFTLVYNAQQSTSGATAAIVSATAPLVTAVSLIAFKGEKVTMNSIVGAVISLVGIFLTFAERLTVSSAQALGILLLFGSVLVNSVCSVFLKKYSAQQHPFVSAGIFSFVSGITFGALALTCERSSFPAQLPLWPAIATVYLALLGSVVTYAAYFYLLKRIKLMTISTMVFFPPIIAMTVDALFEKQVVLTPLAYAGFAVTLMGVAASLLLDPLRKRGTGQGLSASARV